ncbi:MAG: PPO candidate 1 [uncultured Sulfurovum sp.]|uniref:PPO candidate 1 n=1 Tax=uncultured Sulfurovum sp. TaxID=269237 RepID=A0A6S6TTV4_9BACT|nr:MAG: PPO candidate 1 [uncultured Sulfurovum sp.]
MLLDTPICDFGWKAPEFTLQDAHGKSFTMSEHLSEKGLLIMFICNHCPYVIRIAERLAQDTQVLMDEGINVLAVMSNDYKSYAEDSPENMITFAKENNFAFPYLVDEEQSVGKSYGAVCTPDFFGFNASGELQYRGRLDNARMEDASNRTLELVNAMREIAKTGQGPREQVPSMGCSIKWRD